MLKKKKEMDIYLSYFKSLNKTIHINNKKGLFNLIKYNFQKIRNYIHSGIKYYRVLHSYLNELMFIKNSWKRQETEYIQMRSGPNIFQVH